MYEYVDKYLEIIKIVLSKLKAKYIYIKVTVAKIMIFYIFFIYIIYCLNFIYLLHVCIYYLFCIDIHY